MDQAAIKAYSSVIADAAEDSEPQTPVQYHQVMEPEVKEGKAEPFQVDPMGSMIQNEISAIKDASKSQQLGDFADNSDNSHKYKNDVQSLRSRRGLKMSKRQHNPEGLLEKELRQREFLENPASRYFRKR